MNQDTLLIVHYYPQWDMVTLTRILRAELQNTSLPRKHGEIEYVHSVSPTALARLVESYRQSYGVVQLFQCEEISP